MKYVHTNDAPEAIGPYSQAILEQKTLQYTDKSESKEMSVTGENNKRSFRNK